MQIYHLVQKYLHKSFILSSMPYLLPSKLIVNPKKFVIAVLGANNKTFIIYMAIKK